MGREVNNSARLYNEFGQSYLVSNIEMFVESTETDTLINTYMSTLYQNALAISMNELVEKGYMIQKEGEPYNPERTMAGLNAIKKELIARKGLAEFNKIHNKVDLSVILNKPKLPNKK